MNGQSEGNSSEGNGTSLRSQEFNRQNLKESPNGFNGTSPHGYVLRSNPGNFISQVPIQVCSQVNRQFSSQVPRTVIGQISRQTNNQVPKIVSSQVSSQIPIQASRNHNNQATSQTNRQVSNLVKGQVPRHSSSQAPNQRSANVPNQAYRTGPHQLSNLARTSARPTSSYPSHHNPEYFTPMCPSCHRALLHIPADSLHEIAEVLKTWLLANRRPHDMRHRVQFVKTRRILRCIADTVGYRNFDACSPYDSNGMKYSQCHLHLTDTGAVTIRNGEVLKLPSNRIACFLDVGFVGLIADLAIYHDVYRLDHETEIRLIIADDWERKTAAVQRRPVRRTSTVRARPIRVAATVHGRPVQSAQAQIFQALASQALASQASTSQASVTQAQVQVQQVRQVPAPATPASQINKTPESYKSAPPTEDTLSITATIDPDELLITPDDTATGTSAEPTPEVSAEISAELSLQATNNDFAIELSMEIFNDGRFAQEWQAFCAELNV